MPNGQGPDDAAANDQQAANGTQSVSRIIPLDALKDAVSDELIRHPIPQATPVTTQVDPRKLMRRAMIVLAIGAAAAVAVFAVNGEPYHFIEGASELALSALATLFIIALFVERAQQVYVGAWRGIERAALDQRIAKWTKWQGSAVQYPTETQLNFDVTRGLDQAQLELAQFRQITRRYVFALGLSLGVIIAAAGPRLLEQIIEPWGENILQQWVFAFADILITGGLIGGGSEAIHKIMTLITDSLDATRNRVTGGSPQAPVGA